jgi:hypothetical protein
MACCSVSRDRAIGSLKELSCGSVGRYQARAYSSAGLERTPDKREVGGSNPPRPTSSDRPLDGAVAQLVERQLCKLDVVGSIPISSTTMMPGLRVPAWRGRPRAGTSTLTTEYEG